MTMAGYFECRSISVDVGEFRKTVACIGNIARVPLLIRKCAGLKQVVSPNGSILTGAPRQATTTADPALLKALARAFRWKRMLEDRRYGSISDIARAEKLDRTYVGDILRLTLLAPEIV
jgi:hypothetical protein